MRNKLLTAFLLGMMLTLVFGYTRDWTESTPTDATVANQIDDYNRYLRVDMSDRLKNMIYGFTAGETTEGFKYLQFYEQASIAQPSAGYGRLGCKAVGGKCELHWHDEDGDEIQLTTGGKWNGAVLLAASLPSGSYAADSIDSADYAAGSIDAEHLAADIIDETKIADNGIDSEHYNDGSIDTVHIANIDPDSYAAEESTTFANGLIFKHGYAARSGNDTTITYGATFPTACRSLQFSIYSTYGTNLNEGAWIKTAAASAKSSFVIFSTQSNFTGYYWQAWGY